MERRKKEIRKAAVMPRVDSGNTGVVSAQEKSKRSAPPNIPASIEISDADYRSLHMPCDALEEHGDGKP